VPTVKGFSPSPFAQKTCRASTLAATDRPAAARLVSCSRHKGLTLLFCRENRPSSRPGSVYLGGRPKPWERLPPHEFISLLLGFFSSRPNTCFLAAEVGYGKQLKMILILYDFDFMQNSCLLCSSASAM
jgi:hypothetical protein